MLLLSLAFAGPGVVADLNTSVEAGFTVEAPTIPAGQVEPTTVTSAIINGESMNQDDWPMTGGLIMEGDITINGSTLDVSMLMCSSTLIAPDVILTAAHCVRDDEIVLMLASQFAQSGVQLTDANVNGFAWSRKKNLEDYNLMSSLFGDNNLPSDAALASEWKAHKNFSIRTIDMGLSTNDDIGLVFLDEPIEDVEFAILPTAEEDDSLQKGDEVIVVGWGQIENDPNAGSGSKKGGISKISKIGKSEFKVGEEEDDVRKCHGDSGGPTFMTFPSGQVRVIGITSHSWDETDCLNTGGVDTRVGSYLDWIDSQMRKRCENGTRSWCEVDGIIAPPDSNGKFSWEVSAEDSEPSKGCSVAGSGVAGWIFILPLLARRRRLS